MPKHTPGPWVVGQSHNVFKVRKVGKNSYWDPIITVMSCPEKEANASLASAAPDLLEVCKAALLRNDVADCELGEQFWQAIAKAEPGKARSPGDHLEYLKVKAMEATKAVIKFRESMKEVVNG